MNAFVQFVCHGFGLEPSCACKWQGLLCKVKLLHCLSCRRPVSMVRLMMWYALHCPHIHMRFFFQTPVSGPMHLFLTDSFCNIWHMNMLSAFWLLMYFSLFSAFVTGLLRFSLAFYLCYDCCAFLPCHSCSLKASIHARDDACTHKVKVCLLVSHMLDEWKYQLSSWHLLLLDDHCRLLAGFSITCLTLQLTFHQLSQSFDCLLVICSVSWCNTGLLKSLIAYRSCEIVYQL